jgi:drug/metabolite transporter (DMT)-like permease
MKTYLGNKKFLATLGLFAGTVAWGTSFSMIKSTTSEIGVWSFLFWRFFMAALILLPFALKSKNGFFSGFKGFQIGFLIFGILALQTLGLQWTTATRSGFITSLYVAMMPFGLWIYFKRKLAWPQLVVALVAISRQRNK